MPFRGLEQHLEKNIYLTPKGKVRLNVLYNDLLKSAPHLKTKTLNIIDIGGGAGHMTRMLAHLGHNILLCDKSEDMLTRAEEENSKAQFTGNIRLLHSSIDDLPGKVPETFDLVLIHGVLEWLEGPEQSFRKILPLLKAGGYLSLLFYNIDRLILKCGIHGQFKRIQTGTYIQTGKKRKLTPINPLQQETVKRWLDHEGLTILSKAGIRIFYDLFKNDEAFSDRIKELQIVEETYSRIEPYASIAQHIHFVCRNSP